MQNFKVQSGHTLILGAFVYREGDVLPEWCANRDGGLESRLAIGCLAPCGDPANAAVAPPVAKTTTDPTGAIVAESEALRLENAGYAESNRALAGRNKELGAENGRLVKALGETTATIEHLKAACDDHQKEHDRLAAENAALEAKANAAVAELNALKALDAATAPADPKKKADKKTAPTT